MDEATVTTRLETRAGGPIARVTLENVQAGQLLELDR